MSVTILGKKYDIETTTELNLSYKGLTSIPAEIWDLTNLQILSLHNNELTDIPAEIGNLTNLQKLWLHNNELTSLPAEIGNLTNLKLSLYSNKLKSIPKEILKIKNKLSIDETGYDIDNLDLDCHFLIFSKLKSALTNLPVSLKEIYLKKNIKDYNIKLPFGCKIKFF